MKKKRKYEYLAEDLKNQFHASKARVVPIVMSWDAVVTQHFMRHCRSIGLTPNIIAYMMAISLKKTSEMVIEATKL